MASRSVKETIRQEYYRCAKDPVYFMKKYCYIQHPIRGKVLFNLYPFQEKVLHEYGIHRRNIVLKSRQTGISTLTAAFALHTMTFHDDKNILVIATKKDVAKNLITKVRIMNQELPSWMKVRTEEDNKLSLRFKNGSQIKAEAATPTAGRSEALSLLILDEAAFIDYIDEIWTAAQPTLSTGGKVIAVSTPNGIGNWFHKTWVKAEDDVEDWNPIKLPWTVHPERDQEWRDEQDRILGEDKAAQECDADFITSGNNFISADLIKWYEETFVKDPIEKRGPDGNYWLWEYPGTGIDYIISADVARGDSTDYSAFHVFDVVNLTQVAEYKGKVDTKTFGKMLVVAATDYNNALLVVENSNIGWSTIQEILDLGYNNLYYSSKDLQYVEVEKQMSGKFNADEKGMTPGFTTSSKTRPLMTSKLDDYMRERSVVLRSKRLIDELYTFIWKNGKVQAMDGYADDLVMASCMGLWIRDTALRFRKESIKLHREMLDNMSVKSRFTPITTNKSKGYVSNSMIVRGKEENLDWLL